jgi:hypothetical protein
VVHVLNRRDERVDIGHLVGTQQAVEFDPVIRDHLADGWQHVIGLDLVEAWQRRGIE